MFYNILIHTSAYVSVKSINVKKALAVLMQISQIISIPPIGPKTKVTSRGDLVFLNHKL